MSCNMLAVSKKRGIKPIANTPIDTLQQATKPVTHVVRKGETLSKIADKYKDVTYQEIAKANGLSNPNNIYIGQRLNIPNQKPISKTPTPKPNPHIKPIPDETSTGRNKGSGCGKCNFDWAKTPIIKLIISKESKGSYNAYNITGWKNGKNKVFESHFSPTSEYHIANMTLKAIQAAQKNKIGIYKKHLFAIGLYQCIPKTLNSFLNWLKNYQTVNNDTQVFNKEFQDKLPWFFWENKRPTIGKYFRGSVSVESAAYEISKEWASAGTPNGYKIATGKISNGSMSYYGGDGLNKAHYSASKTIDALKKTKAMLDKCDGYEKVKNKQLKNKDN